jgi:hypothetical protein
MPVSTLSDDVLRRSFPILLVMRPYFGPIQVSAAGGASGPARAGEPQQ